MLPRESRLCRHQDFTIVYQKGIRKNTSHLALRALRHQQSQELPQDTDSWETHKPTRIGISISKKVSKGAVVRNRIKRQIRAALRQMLPCISRGWDLVIVVKPTAKQCNYDEFLQQLEKLLAQAEVLHGYSRGSLL
ncbi:MAG: ribonuclease P protein component [Okeania sp. SIO3I5]|uniref:ribonuclease P protein component n=1 Tax=Okeania sp. SIO3I5 TaxID=2607805 RepID=UPI0013B81DE4|nr:ribonuclease P protein component [Okeania sp. SIO3I5]NEQ36627.1 ribonuclease P protein component [Okeania sp. SIO3I5]